MEPFKPELPPNCDWIIYDIPIEAEPEFDRFYEQLSCIDKKNSALKRLVPDRWLRSALVDEVNGDLAMGLAGGFDIGIDRFHGEVVSARFSRDAAVQPSGFALPILVPTVGNLGWNDVATIRRMPAVERLRRVLEEVELEVADVLANGDDIESTVRSVYEGKLQAVASDVKGLGGSLTHGLAELVVGTAAGYGTVALGLLGPATAGVLGATVMTAMHIREVRRRRRTVAWLGVMNALSEVSVR